MIGYCALAPASAKQNVKYWLKSLACGSLLSHTNVADYGKRAPMARAVSFWMNKCSAMMWFCYPNAMRFVLTIIWQDAPWNLNQYFRFDWHHCFIAFTFLDNSPRTWRSQSTSNRWTKLNRIYPKMESINDDFGSIQWNHYLWWGLRPLNYYFGIAWIDFTVFSFIDKDNIKSVLSQHSGIPEENIEFAKVIKKKNMQQVISFYRWSSIKTMFGLGERIVPST